MTLILGWIGLGCMIIGYFFLNSKRPDMFLVMNIISCLFLAAHAMFIIQDVVFIGVNVFAAIMLTRKLSSGGLNGSKKHEENQT